MVEGYVNDKVILMINGDGDDDYGGRILIIFWLVDLEFLLKVNSAGGANVGGHDKSDIDDHGWWLMVDDDYDVTKMMMVVLLLIIIL